MNGDFSRDTSGPARLARYTRVLLQQGRPLLDADFNEQSAIHHEFLRTLAADLLGRAWRPEAGQFTITGLTANDFTITQGHFYVDGILCDNPADCTYTAQPFLQAPPPRGEGNFVAYIACRERHLSALQRPALFEVALGGPDTASRAQIVWQVQLADEVWVGTQTAMLMQALGKRLGVVDPAEKARLGKLKADLPAIAKAFSDDIAAPAPADVSATSQAWFDTFAKVPPRLRAMAGAIPGDDEACAIDPDARYRGRENQLYRVEVHRGGTLDAGKPTFKWSRENGSVAFGVRSGQKIAVGAPDQGKRTLSVPLDSLGHDRRGGICVGDWVEMVSEQSELDGVVAPLGQVILVERTSRSVQVRVVDVAGIDFTACTALRRWDQSAHLDEGGTIPIAETADADGPWIALENGVQVQFQPGGVYASGDYWLIPARVAGGVQWPQLGDKAAFAAADGIVRHRAAIAHAGKAAGNWTVHQAGRTP